MLSRLAATVNKCRTASSSRSEEHTSELQSRFDLVCRLLLEKKKVPASDPVTSGPIRSPPLELHPTRSPDSFSFDAEPLFVHLTFTLGTLSTFSLLCYAFPS